MAQRRSYSIPAGQAKRAAGNEGDLIVEMAFASELPYERWWGIEVLDCSQAAVRLGRLNDGAPVLFNHDWHDLRGTHVPGSVRCDPDKVVRGQVRITSVTQVGRDTIGLVESEVLTKCSVGYEIHRVIEQTSAKDGRTVERELDGALFQRVLEQHELQVRDGRRRPGDVAAFRRDLDAAAGPFERAADDPVIYRVVDWEPFEDSLCTVPADHTVGVGRSVHVSGDATPGRITVLQPAVHTANQGVRMDQQNAAAGTSAEDTAGITAVQLEKERRLGIENLVKANSLDARLADKWITEGTPLSKVAAEILDVMEERGRQRPTAATSLGLSTRETKAYSIFRAIRALRFGGTNPAFMQEAAFEIECARAVAKQLGRELTNNILVPGEVLQRPVGREAAERAMATTPGSKGGYMVDVTNMGFLEILRNRSVSMRMGCRQLSGLVGNVSFARQTGKPSVTWQGGDGTSVTAADQTLGQLSMTPRTAIVITDVSEQLLRQANPSAEQFVMADLAADIAIDGVDNAVINGSGGAQPLGIKNTTGITSGQDASSATYGKILAFPQTAGSANAIRGNPGFVTNTAGAAVLMQRQRFSNTDTPLWTGNMLDGQCVGFNAMSSEQLASGNIIFGSWNEVVIGDWGVLELAMDNGGTRFNQAQVGIRAMWMVDVLVRYPQAFVVGVNLS
jgi:HK97 family phage major capsid protein